MFECRIEADSLSPCGARLITYVVTYPRPIHSEIMTHKALSKSSASSRAIPTEKLIQRVIDDPWIPDYIGKNQKGMQAGEALGEGDRELTVADWLDLRDKAVEKARLFVKRGVHKQIANRILEPWMWITVVISGTEWDNFFGLRDHEAAEPHFQYVARMMKTARDASAPRVLAAGEWHLPFISFDDEIRLYKAPEDLIKIAVGRTARVSYLNHYGVRDLQDDVDLHNRLMVQRPLHAAPAEHVAQAMGWPQWYVDRCGHGGIPFANVRELRQSVVEARRNKDRSARALQAEAVFGDLTSGNFLGFAQYRKTLADEHIGGLMP